MRWLRELRAYRAAVQQLIDNNFIQAHDTVKGTPAEHPIRELIVTMTSTINHLSERDDELNEYIEVFGEIERA